MERFEVTNLMRKLDDLYSRERQLHESLKKQNKILKAILLNAKEQTDILKEIRDHLKSNS